MHNNFYVKYLLSLSVNVVKVDVEYLLEIIK